MRGLNKWYGLTRDVKRFAFFPIKDAVEWRWLEVVKIRQVWQGYWVNKEFLD